MIDALEARLIKASNSVDVYGAVANRASLAKDVRSRREG
jgi:hypothetical protein